VAAWDKQRAAALTLWRKEIPLGQAPRIGDDITHAFIVHGSPT
jgi:hypothetical protein